MPTIYNNTDIATTVTVANLIAGEINEFLGADSVVRLGALSELTGMLITFIIDDVIIVNGQFVPVGGANVPPQDPENVIVEDGGEQGDRMVLSATNNNAAANEITFFIKVTPI